MADYLLLHSTVHFHHGEIAVGEVRVSKRTLAGLRFLV